MDGLVQRDAHDAPLERSDPLQLPALGVAGDRLVQLGAACLGPLRQLAGERLCAGQQLVERPSGYLVLVEGEHRVAALLGAAHQARETYSPERVSTRTWSPSLTNRGTSTTTPDSSVAGLVPPPDAVSPLTPGWVSDTAISTALPTCTPAGRSSTNRTSTSWLGRTHRIVSPATSEASSSCS